MGINQSHCRLHEYHYRVDIIAEKVERGNFIKSLFSTFRTFPYTEGPVEPEPASLGVERKTEIKDTRRRN